MSILLITRSLESVETGLSHLTSIFDMALDDSRVV